MKSGSYLSSQMSFFGHVAVSMLAIFAITNVTAFADDSKLSRELRGASGAKPVYVIVQYNVPRS